MRRSTLTSAVAVVLATLAAAAAAATTKDVPLAVRLPAQGKQVFAVGTITVNLKAGQRPLKAPTVRATNDASLPSGIRAAGGLTAAVVHGRTATFQLVVAIKNFGSFRAPAGIRGGDKLKLSVSSDVYAGIRAEFGDAGLCPSPEWRAALERVRAKFRLNSEGPSPPDEIFDHTQEDAKAAGCR